MSNKMFLLFVLIFSMISFVKAEESVEQAEFAETEEVAPGNKKEEAAEIKEIDAIEKVKEADAAKEITIKNTASKEVAEDEALGKENAELATERAEKAIAEPVVEDNQKSGSSWFSWLWPFSSSDENKEVEAKEIEEKDVDDKVDAPVKKEEEPVEKVVEKKPEVVKVEEQPEVIEADIVAVNEDDKEPVVDDVDADKSESSWFSWLWPFSSSEGVKENDVVEEKETTKVVDVEIVDIREDAEGDKVAEVAVVEEDAKGNVVVKDVAVEEDPEGDVVAVKEEVIEGAPGEPVLGKEEVVENKSSFGRALLLYIPNIFLNLTDIISCGAAVGAEAGVEVRITRFCQFGGQYGESAFIEKAFNRVYGGGVSNGYNFQIAALESEKRYVDDTFGEVKPYIDDSGLAKINGPSDLIYKNGTRDFWAIGVDAGWLVNIRLDIHPIEFVDFLASFIALDISDDNMK